MENGYEKKSGASAEKSTNLSKIASFFMVEVNMLNHMLKSCIEKSSDKWKSELIVTFQIVCYFHPSLPLFSIVFRQSVFSNKHCHENANTCIVLISYVSFGTLRTSPKKKSHDNFIVLMRLSTVWNDAQKIPWQINSSETACVCAR